MQKSLPFSPIKTPEKYQILLFISTLLEKTLHDKLVLKLGVAKKVKSGIDVVGSNYIDFYVKIELTEDVKFDDLLLLASQKTEKSKKVFDSEEKQLTDVGKALHLVSQEILNLQDLLTLGQNQEVES